MTTSWHSYPSVYALGHKAISELLLDDVLVEEKIDGSQFSFGRFGSELKCRSKGQQIIPDAPEKMFAKAVEVVKALPLFDGWTYRAEYLQKPKHNSLAYERVPKNNLILFDINTGEEEYLSYEEKRKESERLGFEIVPILHAGRVNTPDELLSFLSRMSILGGQKVEGVVIKNYNRFGLDKKVLMGKYVSEEFKEIHAGEWKKSNPSNGDIIHRLIGELKTEARWQKAVQHIRERGELTETPKDIGGLIKEAQADIEKECAEHIKDALYRQALHHILRGSTAGIAEWYKQELMKKQFAPSQERDNEGEEIRQAHAEGNGFSRFQTP